MYVNAEPPKSKPFGRLIAWDPVQQKEAWRQEHVSPWNGGTLTTAGNLVFQGTADGRFVAYNAHDRREALGDADRHRRRGGAGHLHGRRQAVRVDRGGLGRRVRHRRARHRPARAGHRLHLRRSAARRRCRSSSTYQHGRAAAGREVRPGARRRKARCSTSATACSATACPAWTAAATSPTSAISAPTPIAQPRQVRVQRAPYTARGMPDFTGKLHRRGRREDQGLHPGGCQLGPPEGAGEIEHRPQPLAPLP